MLVCRVIGSAVSTVKYETLKGFKLLVCKPLEYRPAASAAGSVGSVPPDAGAPLAAATGPAQGDMSVRGAVLLAVDLVGAGEGDVVGVTLGEPARHAAGMRPPVDAAVVAIFDEVTIRGMVVSRATGVKA